MLMVCPRYLPEIGGTEMHVREVTRRLTGSGRFRNHRARNRPVAATAPTGGRWGYPGPACPGLAARARLLPRPRDRGRDRPAQLGSRTLPGHPHAGAIARHDLCTASWHPYLVTFHTGGHSSRLRNVMRTTQWRLAGPLLRNAVSRYAVSHFEASPSHDMPAWATSQSS